MRFANVDGEKIGAIFVQIIDLDEISNLAAERWSSITAENQDEWPFADPFMQIVSRVTVEREYPRVWRDLTNMQTAFVPLRQGVAQEAVGVPRTAHEIGEQEIGSQQQHEKRAENPLPDRSLASVDVFFHGGELPKAKYRASARNVNSAAKPTH